MPATHSMPPRDASRIDTAQDAEMRYWMQTLGVSAKDIKRAVRRVGCSLDKVREHLRLSRSRRRFAH
jgi:hypothetical protein